MGTSIRQDPRREVRRGEGDVPAVSVWAARRPQKNRSTEQDPSMSSCRVCIKKGRGQGKGKEPVGGHSFLRRRGPNREGDGGAPTLKKENGEKEKWGGNRGKQPRGSLRGKENVVALEEGWLKDSNRNRQPRFLFKKGKRREQSSGVKYQRKEISSTPLLGVYRPKKGSDHEY